MPDIDTRETVLSRYKGDAMWTVSTTDPYYIGLLRRRGYVAEFADPTDPYRTFNIPAKAITVLSRSAVEAKPELSPASLDALRTKRAENRRSPAA